MPLSKSVTSKQYKQVSLLVVSSVRMLTHVSMMRLRKIRVDDDDDEYLRLVAKIKT